MVVEHKGCKQKNILALSKGKQPKYKHLLIKPLHTVYTWLIAVSYKKIFFESLF